jgi:5-methylthioadenosine/S-adenosylhomocysteine deaminase
VNSGPKGTLFEGGAVVTVDDEFTVHDPGWVHVVDDRIAALGPGGAPDSIRESVGRRIDASEAVVMPGMVNAHTHLFQTFFRGLADDKPLLDWLRQCIWPGAIHLDRESARLAALLGLVENLRTGATSVIDHQYIHVNDQIDDAVCEAADELGVRLRLARGWADQNYEPQLSESANVILERTSRLRDRWGAHPRVRIEFAPLIPWGCSDDTMRATLDQAREWGVGTHIHCAETLTEIEMSIEDRGVRHVEWLDQLGALGPDLQLAHSIWLDDHELDLIAASGSVVVHCPVSNMYLASGVARLLDMKARDIPIALASDGPGSNNRQDMFEVLKTTVLLQKVHHLDAMALQPEDAVAMACRGGARAFGSRAEIGTPDELGRLVVGANADITVVDLNTVSASPVHRPVSSLVFCCSPADVTHVMVGGDLLIDDRTLTVIDEEALLEEARSVARQLFKRAGIDSRLAR